MAYVERAGLGPTFLEPLMLGTNAQPISGLIVATTDDDGASPPIANCYWIKEAAGVTSHQFSVGPGGPAITPLAFEWPICAVHRLEAGVSFDGVTEEWVVEFDMDGGGGDCIVLFDSLSGSTFRYRLVQTGGNNAYGSGTFNTNENHALLFQFDGTDWKLWVDGTLDASVAVTDMPLDFHHISSGIVSARGTQYFCGLGWRASDAEADLPGTFPTIEGSNPKGDNESAVFSDESCNGADGAGQWQDWDDDGADDSNTTIAMCDDAATAGEETSDMDDIIMDDPDLVVLRFLGTGIFGGKTGTTYCRIINGSANVSEVQNANIALTSWRGFSRAFPLDANGDPWTKLRVNDTNAGIRSLGTNDESTGWGFLRMETFKWGDEPPSNRRRALAQVV